MIKQLARALPLLAMLLASTPALAQSAVTNGITPGEDQNYTGPTAPYNAPRQPGQSRTYTGPPKAYPYAPQGYNRQYTNPSEPYVDPNDGNPGSGFTPGQGLTIPGPAGSNTRSNNRASHDRYYTDPSLPNTGTPGAGQDQMLGGPPVGTPYDQQSRHYRNNHHF